MLNFAVMDTTTKTLAHQYATRLTQSAAKRSTAMREWASQNLVPALVDSLQAEGIWIFGSVARQDASPNSDLDVLVKNGSTWDDVPWKKRMDVVYDVTERLTPPFPVDIVVLSHQEIAAKLQSRSPYFLLIWHEKEALYEHKRESKQCAALVVAGPRGSEIGTGPT